MIDKTQRKATVEQTGSMVVVRMTGGPDCLWLNMYLDTEAWQMTCDSDIGFYAYHWGKRASRTENFEQFCCRWLADDEWLLRKCIGENRAPLAFDVKKTEAALRELFAEYNEDNPEEDLAEDIFCSDIYSDLNDAIDMAFGYSGSRTEWAVAMQMAADTSRVELPEGWWDCTRRR